MDVIGYSLNQYAYTDKNSGYSESILPSLAPYLYLHQN